MRDSTYRTLAGTCGAFAIAAAMFYAAPVQAQAPKYEVDPLWPKLPNNWVVGPLGAACVDAQDHVIVLHRQEEVTDAELNARDQFAKGVARIKAPPVMEFDPEGNLVNSWGDIKVLGNYLHDCLVDKDGNVWIAPARSGFVQKYSHDGKLLLQIGKSGVFDSSDGTAKGKPLNSNTAQFFGPSARSTWIRRTATSTLPTAMATATSGLRCSTRTERFCASFPCTTPRRKRTSRCCRIA